MKMSSRSKKVFSLSVAVSAVILAAGVSAVCCASADIFSNVNNKPAQLRDDPLTRSIISYRSEAERAQKSAMPDEHKDQIAVSENLPAWTVMVYMAGDNNLEGLLINNILEMEQALPPGVEIIVQLDRSKGFSTVYGNWTGARIYRVKRNPNSPDMHAFYAGKSLAVSPYITSQLLEEIGDINTADPDNIEKFVRYAAERFPARRYAFVSMDHGGGWHSNMGDDEYHSNMTIGQLTAAVKRGASLLPRKKFDLIIYDMCLMGQIDVAYETAGAADYMVASPPSIPSYATDYVSVLPYFTADISTRDLGKKIVELNTRFFNYFNGVSENAAFSLYDLSSVPEMLDAVRSLTGKLKKHARTDTEALTVNTSLTYHYGDKAFDDFSKGKYMFSSLDLEHWMSRLQKISSDFDPEIAKIRAAMKQMVVAAETTDDFNYPGGIGIYVPLRRANVYDGYFTTAFAAESGMTDYLSELFSAQDEIAGNVPPPEIGNIEVGNPRLLSSDKSVGETRIEIEPVDTVVPMSGTAVKFEISGRSILGSTISQVSWDKRNPERKYLNFVQLLVDLNRRGGITDGLANDSRDIMPEYADGSNYFVREMTGQKYRISDGMKLYDVTVFHNDFEFEKLSFAGLYRDSTVSGDIPVIVSFDSASRKISQVRDAGSGKTIVPSLNATVRIGVLAFRDLRSAGAETVYSQPVSLSQISILLTNLSDNEAFVYKIDSSNIWGKTAEPAFSGVLNVSNSKRQLEMISNFKKLGKDVFDTYAVAYFAQDGNSEMTLLPTFDQWTLVANEKSKRESLFSSPAWHNNSGRHGQLFFNISDDQYAPAEMRFSLANDAKDNLYRDNVTSYQVYMDSAGSDRVIYFVGLGTGTRLALYPLSEQNGHVLQGEWIADTHRWIFRGNTVNLEYSGDSAPELKGKYSGTYEVRDNVITITSGNFPKGMERMAFIYDRASDYLSLKGASKYLMYGVRSLSSGDITLPELRKQLKGSWISGDGDRRVELKIDRVDDTRYLHFVFSFKGTVSEAYVAVDDGKLFMNYAGGTRAEMKFSYRSGEFTIVPQSGAKWVFTRQ